MSGFLIDSVSNVDFLRKCWNEVISGKSYNSKKNFKGVDGISILDFEMNAEDNILEISKKIKDGSYEMSQLYGYNIEKANGKYRLITAPTVSDRIVHRAILKIIRPYFETLTNNGVSYSGISGQKDKRINYLNAFQQLKKNIGDKNFYIFGSDIKGFFDNIPKKSMVRKIIKELPDKSLNNLIEKIIFYEIKNEVELILEGKTNIPDDDKGLSQGSPLSPLFSNIFLIDFDKKIKDICGYKMIRYVDDFIICAKTKEYAEQIGRLAEKTLNKMGLELAKDKTKIYFLNDSSNIKENTVNFLGLKITKYGITHKKDQKEIISKLESEYLNFDFLCKRNRSVKKNKIIEKMNNKVRGYANYYQYFHTVPLFKKINQIIAEKKKQKKYKGLNYIDESGSKQLFTENQWRELFD